MLKGIAGVFLSGYKVGDFYCDDGQWRAYLVRTAQTINCRTKAAARKIVNDELVRLRAKGEEYRDWLDAHSLGSRQSKFVNRYEKIGRAKCA